MNTINAKIITATGRFETMTNMVLERDYKQCLAKEGLFYYNNMIRCIGCYITLKKLNQKHLKRHTFSDNCITTTNLLKNNETLRKKSFSAFKSSRRHFKKILVVDMLARRGFYSFGKRNYIRCSQCLVTFKYLSMENAQQQHCHDCDFLYATDDCEKLSNQQILHSDLSPPNTYLKPSAPELPSSDTLECKICFDAERVVCFMPCKHLVACETCSRRCKKCCVCNEKIEHRIVTIPQ
ncbi:IAP-2 [Parapoynx stagnalis nucleopolyhedrovirus]|uniref:IAP-2 n=1 Tax=Parapoynx stagnalis nucleopolyhedrovirus TaxID=2993413 RepID=A0A9E7YF98_9ABAC|nr:IAP-2 [Parapoynx stagnalis nucleopolyhedrovirus]